MSRLIALPLVLVLCVFAALVLSNTVFRPPPASSRLAGVTVGVVGYTVTDLGDHRHRLNLSVSVASARDLNECVGFTLDEPFATRRLDYPAGGCVAPRMGSETVQLVFDRLSDEDVNFASHTLVWGIPGGRCGPILGLFGVCVIEQAGTAKFDLPPPPGQPSFGPIGSFGPIFSFAPIFSFDPQR